MLCSSTTGFAAHIAGYILKMAWYTVFAPPKPLSHVLACSYTATPAGRHRLVPDGCIDLVSTTDGSLWLCGPERTGWDFELPVGVSATGVRFRPGAASAVIGCSAAGLADNRWRLRTIVGSDAEDQLRSDVAKGGLADTSAALERFVAVLVARMAPQAEVLLRFSDSVLDALAESPRANTALLADSLGMGVRQLHRRALWSFGYGPATLARLLRLQRFLAIASMDARSPVLGRLAVDAGYSDQAHLTRECRTICGLTPVELLGQYVATFPDMSDPFKTSGRFAVSMCA